MKINSFKDIEVWQKARVLFQEIYIICKKLEKEKEFSISDQIKRSAMSIMANIAEGFARQTSKEFIQFLFIANGSAVEVNSHLYCIHDLGFIDNKTFEELEVKVTVIQKMLSGFIKYLRKTTKKTKVTKQTI